MKTLTKTTWLTLTFVISIFLSVDASVYANYQQKSGQQGRSDAGSGGLKRPPKEAVMACQSLSAGDSCSFEGRQGKSLDGTCFTPESSKPLACKPAGR